MKSDSDKIRNDFKRVSCNAAAPRFNVHLSLHILLKLFKQFLFLFFWAIITLKDKDESGDEKRHHNLRTEISSSWINYCLLCLKDAKLSEEETQKLNGHSWECILIMLANKPPFLFGNRLRMNSECLGYEGREKTIDYFHRGALCLDNEGKYTKKIVLIHKTTITRCGFDS